MELNEKVKTHCPRCGNKEATLTKTKTHYVLHCNECDFDMGNPRIDR